MEQTPALDSSAAMQHDEGTFAGAGGLALYYQRWRPPQEPPRAVLALVHGVCEHSGRYANLVDYLVPRGYAVYGFDLRGHGQSPGKRGHINAWAEFREDVRSFLAVVEREEPGRPLFLMGHSMGALIALEYALVYPAGLRGLIASAPPLDEGVVSRSLILLSGALSRVWPGFSANLGLDPGTLSRDPAVGQAYLNDPLCHRRGTARWGTEQRAAMARVRTRAAELRVPLLIVHGSADRLAPAGAIRTFFERLTVPDRERYEYEGGYHELHNDLDAERVLADVEGWLARHLPGSAT